ncbi:MAG: Bro-N domain-containing protein [Candidatus Nitricoxidivorans perseverans]|uniref:Bro-N domain-containing protein n=1 Tax=Candidatus Nitricoxidivorans perseverans TaxID=2975601 RepID=A0AA49FK24_9PROT|nr:MAG: Bro-N domain-containing protein [Candidatus Nitricoxidivorans perseverans]
MNQRAKLFMSFNSNVEHLLSVVTNFRFRSFPAIPSVLTVGKLPMSKKIMTLTQPDQQIAVFQETAIRRTWYEGQWWFSVIDVVGILSESNNANRYWSDLKRKLAQEAGSGQPYEKIVRLKLAAPDGKQRETDCANTETLFRIIQSIPSPRTEPFKRWLAQVGYERVKEIGNPELASARARELYQAKGYPQAWIEKRLRSIAVRGELTDEWKARGVAEGREYAILTAEIAKATFGVTPGAHSRLKGLDKVKTGNNLRDHMTDLELIFTMLGKAGTTEIARRKDAQGFAENRHAAKAGGAVAGNARKELEAKTGKPVASRANYLALDDAEGAGAADYLGGEPR